MLGSQNRATQEGLECQAKVSCNKEPNSVSKEGLEILPTEQLSEKCIQELQEAIRLLSHKE